MRNTVRNVLFLLLGVVLGAAAVAGYVTWQPLAAGGVLAGAPSINVLEASEPAALAQSSAQAPVGIVDEAALAAIYERVSPGVVNITTSQTLPTSIFRQPGPQQPPDFIPPTGAGSGFVIDEEGHILTNYHVVDGRDRVNVTLADGSRYEGRVVGQDPINDLALVKIDAPREKLTVVPLGDSDRLKVGYLAIAIGNPFGLDRSMTLGIVSSLGRVRADAQQRPIRNMIQTDAAVNPGNSGGPLLNAQGEAVGVISSIESPIRGSVGVGFAVPINTAKEVLPDLKAGRTVEHPWVGIGGRAITPEIADALDLASQEGVLVQEVTPGSPAERAGLRGADGNPRQADIIIAVDDQPVKSVEDMVAYLDTKSVGDTVGLTVIREGTTITVDVTLGAFPTPAPRPRQP